MKHDIRTIWAVFATWARGIEDPPARTLGGLALYIYPAESGEPGAYRMHGPRLYWQPEGADHFQRTDDDLPAPDAVSHIIASGGPLRRGDDRYWPTWAAFAQEVGLLDA